MKVFQATLDAIKSSSPAALVTVIGVMGSAPRRSGARMLVYADGRSVGTVGGGRWEHLLIEQALAAMELGRSRRVARHLTLDLGMCCGGAMEAMVEVLDLQPELHLWGAGHVAQCVAPLALGLGFSVRVYDEREELLSLPAFDDCERVPGPPRSNIPQLGPADYGLILTHDHALDQDLVERLLPQSFAYLGMIGSRAKVTRFFQRFEVAGMDTGLFSKLSAPVGLDLGAVTPAEIAVAIGAELVQVRRGQAQPAQSLSSKPLAARGGSALAPKLNP